MRLVILESPYAGDIDRNVAFARACLRDCLQRGEAPIASHLLFTQEGVLRDDVPGERRLGIDAGLEWYRAAEAAVFYLNLGESSGMVGAIEMLRRRRPHLAVEWRFHNPVAVQQAINPSRPPIWNKAQISAGRNTWTFDHAIGRLEVWQHRNPPTEAAPWAAAIRNEIVANYPSLEAAQAGAWLVARHRTTAIAGAAIRATQAARQAAPAPEPPRERVWHL